MKIARIAAALTIVLTAWATCGSAVVAPAATSAAPADKGVPDLGRNGTKPAAPSSPYFYVDGYQYATALGASVVLKQAKPSVSRSDFHSLAELAVQSQDGQQIVEVGWTVSKGTNGDRLPHLFVFHWVDRTPSCYNGCGFVQVSTKVVAGQAVTVGAGATYALKFTRNKWWAYYDGEPVGYFPASLWGGRFTQAGLTQAFGEVSATSSTPCTDMGNGTFGSERGSARISHFTLIRSSSAPSLLPLVTDASLYDMGALTATSFRFGGPGAC